MEYESIDALYESMSYCDQIYHEGLQMFESLKSIKHPEDKVYANYYERMEISKCADEFGEALKSLRDSLSALYNDQVDVERKNSAEAETLDTQYIDSTVSYSDIYYDGDSAVYGDDVANGVYGGSGITYSDFSAAYGEESVDASVDYDTSDYGISESSEYSTSSSEGSQPSVFRTDHTNGGMYDVNDSQQYVGGPYKKYNRSINDLYRDEEGNYYDLSENAGNTSENVSYYDYGEDDSYYDNSEDDSYFDNSEDSSYFDGEENDSYYDDGEYDSYYDDGEYDSYFDGGEDDSYYGNNEDVSYTDMDNDFDDEGYY